MGVGQRGMGRGIWGHPGKGGGTRAHTKAAGCFLRVRTLRKKWTQAKVPAPAPAPGEAPPGAEETELNSEGPVTTATICRPFGLCGEVSSRYLTEQHGQPGRWLLSPPLFRGRSG